MRHAIPTIVISLFALMLFIICSPYNLGITPDSVNYIEAAKNITNGNGYTINGDYITHWPPIYPLLLSLVNQLTGVSILSLGKYLNIIFFILLGVSFYGVLNEIKFHKIIKPFILSVLLISAPLTISLFFWSELPFITFITLSFYYFLRWKKAYNAKLLVIAGCFALFAFLTRYAAVGILIGFYINFLFTSSRRFRDKILDILYFSLPLAIGTCIWLYYAVTHATSTIGRSLAVNLISLDKILNACSTIKSWFISGRLSYASFILVIALIIIVAYTHRNKLKTYLNDSRSNVIQITTIIVSYVLFLFISISFFDSLTPLDNRILSPLWPFILLLIGYSLNFMAKNASKKHTIITVVFLLIGVLSTSKSTWIHHYKNGNGYSSKKFSGYTEILRKYVFSHKGITYTNGDDLIMLSNTNHSNILSIPKTFDPVTKQENKNYTNELNKMKENVLLHNAQIIYFDRIDWRWYLTSKEELLQLNPTNQVINFKNGFIIKALQE